MREKIKFLFTSVIFLIASQSGSAQIINTVAGNGTAGFYGDGGPATSAKIHSAFAVAVDDSDILYIADTYNNRIRKVDHSGVITTIAGTGSSVFAGDGGMATAASFSPTGIAIDHSGNIYISDQYNNCVREINTAGIINTVAGIGGTTTFGYSGDGGAATAAELNEPVGITVDDSGNLYIADQDNYRIRKVTHSSGIITTIAGDGTSGFSGDSGSATAARLNDPWDVAVDNSGNVYISDQANSRIRKVNGTGIITTYAGSGSTGGFAGDGGAATAARINSPFGITLDSIGNLYFVDDDNQRIRKVDTAGIITTIAGNGIPGFSGDGGSAIAAELHFPIGIAISHSGKVYFTDAGNQRVRVITDSELAPHFIHGDTQSISLCENATDSINGQLAIIDTNVGQTETWSVKVAPLHGVAVAAYTASSAGDTIIPAGLTYTPFTGFIGTDSFTIQVNDGTDTAYTTIHVTVNPSGTAGVITGTDSICTGSTITLADSVAGGVWSSSNDTVSEVFASGLVVGIAPGTDTIFYNISGSCGSATVSAVVTVITSPVAAAITGDSMLCAGTAYTLADTTTGGVWSTMDSGISVDSATGLFTALMPGTDTIYYTLANSCGLSVAQYTVTVNPLPVAGTVTGPYSVCVGDSVSLDDTAAGGVWSAINEYASADSSDGVITGLAPGLDTIYYAVSTYCGTDSVSKTIKVTALITDSITGRSWVCTGDTATLATTAGISGTWSASNGDATISPAGIVTGLMPGVDTITYTASGSCVTDTPKVGVTIFTTAQCDSALSVIPVSLNNPTDIVIYPNPAAMTLNIGTAQQVNVTVLSMDGRTLIKKENATSIDISRLSSGLYIIQICNAGNSLIKTAKFTKE